MVIYAVLEKKNILSYNKDKNIKMGSLCYFREKKYCRKKNVFFGFLPPTNENKIKTLKKTLFR